MAFLVVTCQTYPCHAYIADKCFFLPYDLFNLKGLKAMPELVIQALALTIHHLKQFGFERILCLEASYRPFASITEMTLSANALQQLEVSGLVIF